MTTASDYHDAVKIRCSKISISVTGTSVSYRRETTTVPGPLTTIPMSRVHSIVWDEDEEES